MQKLDLSTVDLNLLALLEALLEERNVTRAGDRLGLSQPAASRALGRLRQMLGDPLFVRTPQGLLPTPLAAELEAPLQDALGAVRRVLQPPSFEPATATGALRLLTPDHESLALIPTLLDALAMEAPGLDLDIRPRPADPLAALAAGDLDLAIGVYPDAPAGFRRQRLYSDELVCVLRRDHPVLRRGLTLDAYLELKHVLIAITGTGGGVIDDLLAQQGLTRRVVLRIPQFLAAPLVVARSNLIVTMPRRLAREVAKFAPVVLVPPPLPAPVFDISQLWHERQQADPRHRWLRQLLVRLTEERRGAAGVALDAGGDIGS